MRKTVLFVVLFILFASLSSFVYSAFVKQKEYFELKESNQDVEGGNTSESYILPSVYQDYQDEALSKSLLENRIILLYFTSNWCEKCLEQDIVNKEVFEILNNEGIVGLRIHILDSETTQETDALAKKYEVSKEHSFVVLDKKGAISFKHLGVLDKDSLKRELLKIKEVED